MLDKHMLNMLSSENKDIIIIIMIKPVFLHMRQTKAQISCTAPLFPLNRYYSPFTSYIPNFVPQAIFCGCTAQFVSDLVEDLTDRFSHGPAQMISIASL